MADSKLSALTAATTLASTDQVYLNQGGTSKRTDLAALQSYIAGNGSGLTLDGGHVLWETDFLSNTVSYSSSAGVAANFHYYVAGGGALTVNYAAPATNPGICRLANGNGSGGVVSMGLTSNINDTSGSTYLLDSDDLVLDYLFRVDNVSSSDRYWHLGMVNDVDLYSYEFRVVLDSGVPKLRAANNSVATMATLSPSITANTWTHLQIRASSSSIRAYLNGTLAATVSTNIPTAGMFPVFQCGGNPAGAVNLDLDAFRISKVLSSNRAATFLSSFGGSNAPRSPDTHPSVPNTADDEFEETSLNARWTWRNQGGATATLSYGSVVLTAPASSGDNLRIIEQSVTGSWKYRAKVAARALANYAQAGICAINSSSGKVFSLGKLYSSDELYIVAKFDSVSSYNSALVAGTNWVERYGSLHQWCYFEIEYDSTTLYFRVSGNGVHFDTLGSEASATFLGTPDKIGLFAQSNNASEAGVLVCDWFRRIS